MDLKDESKEFQPLTPTAEIYQELILERAKAIVNTYWTWNLL